MLGGAVVVGVVALGCNGQAVEAQPRTPVEADVAGGGEPNDGGLVPAVDPGPPQPLLTVPAGALDALHVALDKAERDQPDGRALLVFFGDSHTAGDQLTGYLRRRLGGRFGDAGRGFVLAGRPPIRHYYLRDIRYGSAGRWAAELGGKKGNLPPFGLAGVRAHSDRRDATAWVESCDQCGSDRVARFDVFYLRTSASGTLGFRVDDGAWQKWKTRLPKGGAGERTAAVLSVPVREGRHRLTLRPSGGGPVELFGVALERGTPGVVVDALGVVGRRLGHLRSWDWDIIGPQLAARAPALVVLQYGTNEADDPTLDLDALARQYDEVIALVRSHAPGASILVLGPPDMGERDAGRACDKLLAPRRGVREPEVDLDAGVPPECVWHTPALLPQVIEVQRAAAARNRVAFFDTFAALGGADQMDLFFHRDPPLAYSDHVHLTQPGAELWGQHLVEALLAGYSAWKQPAALEHP